MFNIKKNKHIITLFMLVIFVISCLSTGLLNNPLFAAAETYELEGFTKEPTEGWTKGIIKGYKELEWVPFQLVIENYDGTATEFTVKHDYKDGAYIGFDDADSFVLSAEDGTVIDSSAWSVSPVDKSGTYLEFVLTIVNPLELKDKGYITFSWEALLAGPDQSSNFPGGSLQTRLELPRGKGADKTVSIMAPPVEYGSLLVHKSIGSLDGDPQAGVSFTLTDAENAVLTGTTDANGEYTFTNLVPGTYTLDETVPDGYEYVSGLGEYVITALNTSRANVINRQKQDPPPPPVEYGSLLVHKSIGSLDGDPQAGVSFTLTDAENAVLTGTTDANGEYTFTNLVPGTYTLDETVPDGYEYVSGLGEYVITALNTSRANVINRQKQDPPPPPVEYGSLLVHKSIGSLDGDPQAGVSFTLTDAENAVLTGTTDANGEYTFTNLVPGTYTLDETVPDGYEYVSGLGEYVITALNTSRANVINRQMSSSLETDTYDDNAVENEIPAPAALEEEVPPKTAPAALEEELPPITPPAPELPYTGGNTAAYMVNGLLLLGLGFAVRRNKK